MLLLAQVIPAAFKQQPRELEMWLSGRAFVGQAQTLVSSSSHVKQRRTQRLLLSEVTDHVPEPTSGKSLQQEAANLQNHQKKKKTQKTSDVILIPKQVAAYVLALRVSDMEPLYTEYICVKFRFSGTGDQTQGFVHVGQAL